MSNRVDFYQSQMEELSLAADSVQVFVDGSLCPYLEPVRIVRSGWPKFGWVKLAVKPSEFLNGNFDNGDIDSKIAEGRNVRIERFYGKPGAEWCGFQLGYFCRQDRDSGNKNH